MFEYDCYDEEMFAFAEGDIEVFTLPQHSEPENITYDSIEDSVEDYYSTMGYPNTDTKELINLVMNLFEGGNE